MERVSIFRTSQRIGEGESPVSVKKYPKITPELQAEMKRQRKSTSRRFVVLLREFAEDLFHKSGGLQSRF